jgi:uracil-DNA glycosylase
VLPDIDADDGRVGQERVLVGRRGDLQTLGLGVQALQIGTVSTRREDVQRRRGKRTSQPQPEPWMAALVVLNSFLKLSKVPKDSSMAFLRGPSCRRPPLPLPSEAAGARFFQNKEWLMCPVMESVRTAYNES